MGVKHAFTNPKSDGGDTTITRPSDWNADHTISQGLVQGQTAATSIITIPGMSASPDIIPASPNGSDLEFDSTTIGGTALSSPTTIDANTTFLSCLYIKKSATATFGLHGRYWSIPSMPFTMTAKLLAGSLGRLNFQRIGAGIAEATPGKTEGLYWDYNGARYTSTISTTSPSAGAAYVAQGTQAADLAERAPLWFRCVVASSTDITWYRSSDGLIWSRHGAASRNPGFTIGSFFLAVDPEQATYDEEAAWDYVRFT